jgi:hypothetical protein
MPGGRARGLKTPQPPECLGSFRRLFTSASREADHAAAAAAAAPCPPPRPTASSPPACKTGQVGRARSWAETAAPSDGGGAASASSSVRAKKRRRRYPSGRLPPG